MFTTKNALKVILVILLSILCFMCNSGPIDENTAIANALKAYSRDKELSSGHLDKMIEDFLQKAEEDPHPYYYAMVGQLYMVDGDFEESINILNEASIIFPNINDIHYLLADAYYGLAFYDMMRKGNYKINVIPCNKMPKSNLIFGHPKSEILELTISFGRPALYAKIMKEHGFNEEKCMQIKFYILSLSQGLIKKLMHNLLFILFILSTCLKKQKWITCLKYENKKKPLTPNTAVVGKRRINALFKNVNQLLLRAE